MNSANLAGECAVQTRLEAVASISKRHNSELNEVACRLYDILVRLRGEHPEQKKEDGIESPNGLLEEIELSLRKREGSISWLGEIERELRSLI